ncbi:hypothetical protein BW723_04885 [Polaribacter reichenbachii]|uniref:Plasmid stabilization protein n=1 Tax=Polaribacter reichenbachii TaxID=996801 RepID=A0A1B8TUG0_9FLAO|nr:type II toxin-antitoxin system RelE/ParE family toxin [Polaribacter reichenbachii]APZ45673.1 hypothetical protein BW723_04885 [Polaribacter reichenbachii]AUC19535.1 hypothetical protein BTO17_12895 [Polaribacter reichenbachii]OBY63311.1 hypothetical protein LPB301_10825 [Polaribacter reichenbachii]
MVREIIWTNNAEADLNFCFSEFLEHCESLDVTKRIFIEIYNSVSILATNAEIYKLDLLKKNNKGNIRFFEKHSYRISYLIDTKFVYILRIRPSRKEPLEF